MRKLLAAALLAVSPALLACGYCVEDKIASTYDHAVVTRAIGAQHHVVYFHIDGPLVQDAATGRALAAAAQSVPGVDRDSVRVKVETLTISLAFDPRRVRLLQLQSALEKKLASRRLTLMPLRIMETPGDLATVRR